MDGRESVGKRRASTGATGDGYGLTYTPNGAWQFGTGPWDANGELVYYDPSNGQHTDLNATLWNHVVYSYDGSKERVFINGQFVQSRDSNGSPVANSQPLTIGGQNGNYLQRVHNGKIDELRIYNRSLSAGEISQLHHWESQSPTPPNITAQPVSDQNATTGGNITFNIGAAGDGNSYQWQKRDANGTWINIDGANSNSYAINSLQLSHAGTYRAAVTSASGGTAYSSESTLNITLAPGAKIWDFVTGGAVNSSPAIGSDGTVYVGSNDRKLYAINSQTGAKLWEFEAGHDFNSSSPAIGSDGTVYVGSWDKKLYAINGQTGVKLWEFETGSSVWGSSPAIGSDGTVYVGSNDKKVYALNPDGSKKWEYETGGDVRSSPAIGSDGTVYVGSLDKKLYALNGQTGEKLWEYETGSDVSSPAIGLDGTVYVGSWIEALNGKTGAKLWEFDTGNNLRSSPAIGSDGTIYVGSQDRKIYAINGQTGVKLWEFEMGSFSGKNRQ